MLNNKLHNRARRRIRAYAMPIHPSLQQQKVKVGNKVYRVGTSKSEKDWLDRLGIKDRQKVFYGFQGKIFVVDGIDEIHKIVYEYLGEQAHGSHKTYKTNRDKLTWLGKTPNQLYYETLERFNFLTNLGYKVFFVWYLDHKKGITGRFYRGKGDSLY